MLNTYMTQLQRFIRDQKQQYIDVGNMVDYINRARREVAGRTQCCRILTPISGQCMTATVTAGGSNYSNSPTVTITPPDFPSGRLPNPGGKQATASAAVQGGVITAVNILYGGDGYFQPQCTITDTTGTGATATVQISPINILNPGQEQYLFSGINLSGVPGAESVYAVRSASVIYSNYRYSLPLYSFSTYQSMIRQWPFQYQYVPTFFSQLGQGASGSLYFFPLPSQVYQYELDCQVLPQNLIDDLSVELIPQPWQDAVPYFAASLAFAELQNLNASKYYLDLYEKMVLSYSQYARLGRAVNPYGRY